MPIPVPGRLAESVRQSVAQVLGKGGSLGSGVVVKPGSLVTNAHVLPNANQGSEVRVESWEGASLTASVMKINRSRDLALLAVPRLKAAPLPLGDSEALRAGMPVFAIGNPLGFVGAVSSGVIHQANLRRWVCADVRLAPGNSGGPLMNFSGQIVGINTMLIRGGLALAVPSRSVEKFLKHEDSRNLGVVVKGVEFRGRFGVLVTGIVAASAAERASLLPGDILTGANGVTFAHADDLTDAIDGAANGLLDLEFYRGDGKAARHVTADLTGLSARTAA
jgi:serine protease Do